MTKILDQVDRIVIKSIYEACCDLVQLGSAELAQTNKSYFKSAVDFLGVSKSEINKIARSCRQDLKNHSPMRLKSDIDTLARSNVHEFKSLAVVLSGNHWAIFDEYDEDLFCLWLEAADSWDIVDEMSIRTIGQLYLTNPSVTLGSCEEIGCLWIRRAQILLFLPQIRKSEIPSDLFFDRCRRLSGSREFFEAKAVGWALRELSEHHPRLVIDFVASLQDCAKIVSKEALRKVV